MPNNPDRIEVLSSIQRRRRYSLDEKMTVLAEAAQPGMPWQAAKAEPKLRRFVTSYLLIENEVLANVLPAHFDRMNVHPLVPESK